MLICKQLKTSFLLLIIALSFTQCNLETSSNNEGDLWVGAYKDFARKFSHSLLLDLSIEDSLITIDTYEKDTFYSSYRIENDSIRVCH